MADRFFFAFLYTLALLNHQAEFGIILAEIYDPSLGVPSGEVTPRRVQTAPESVQAVDDFQAVMREIRDLLLPEVVRGSFLFLSFLVPSCCPSSGAIFVVLSAQKSGTSAQLMSAFLEPKNETANLILRPSAVVYFICHIL
jgi:hypothetical protein